MKRVRGRLWMLTGVLAAVGIAVLTLGVGMRGADAQGGAAVSIVDFAFQPASLEIAAGTTVTWTNNGAASHTVTADTGAFDSGTLGSGASFSQTFDTPGSFAYHCEIHPRMTGTIVVTAGAAAEEPAAAAAADQAPAAAQVPAAETVQAMPKTGVGTMVLAARSGGIALLAGIVAAVLGVAALLAYRRV